MTLLDGLSLLSWLDIAGLTLLVLCWFGIGWRIEHPMGGPRSVSNMMLAYREDWMREFVTRQPRIFDASILSTLRQGTTFFASSCMIAIGAGLALIANPQPLSDVAGELVNNQSPAILWEIKLLPILLYLVSAFLAFVWAHRQFGYCAVLMASVPNDPENPISYPRAEKAAELNSRAARSFNRGMRSVYYALGATAWLVGAVPLILGALAVTAMIWRREFASHSRALLMREDS
ncbi:DUF599 domain-containing protein [Aliiruegeria sabulilitoris]|uniref:DUF599 domain-containing protein n=1 Tax=Aliiruegeria sabulilitoris TaxID=1510458 RepID=UPI0008359891|nr:DUF599 domain-containing protein [Aliiruegeria sabulilitoris]NDR59677.1 DUF599 domain-containing protein [Pseudoruegeria sp. M32A2M]